MAVKVTRADKQTQEQNTAPADAKVTEVLYKHLARFDVIDTYTKAIDVKLDELLKDLQSSCNNPLVIMHLRTIRQLLQDIDYQVEQATDEDIKGE